MIIYTSKEKLTFNSNIQIISHWQDQPQLTKKKLKLGKTIE